MPTVPESESALKLATPDDAKTELVPPRVSPETAAFTLAVEFETRLPAESKTDTCNCGNVVRLATEIAVELTLSLAGAP